jgi:Ca-activated chloride channel family protein
MNDVLPRAVRLLTSGSLLLASLSGAGCSRKSGNPLLSFPSSGVTDVSMLIPQIDTADAPDNRIFVSVLDNSGNALTDFQLGNFSVVEDGKPGVPYEEGRVNEPLSIALVLDRSGSMSGSRTTNANLAGVALVNAMSAADSMALIEFSSDIRLSVDFTSDKSALSSAINAGVAGGATALYDAVGFGARQLLGRPGRRMLLVLTDGADTASLGTLADAVKSVNNRGLSCYTVGLGQADIDYDQAVLTELAQSTGASFAASADGSNLTTIFLSFLNRMNNLVYVKYRRRSKGTITLYLNYGAVTDSAVKSL